MGSRCIKWPPPFLSSGIPLFKKLDAIRLWASGCPAKIYLGRRIIMARVNQDEAIKKGVDKKKGPHKSSYGTAGIK